jgi:outer membrane protein TolC
MTWLLAIAAALAAPLQLAEVLEAADARVPELQAADAAVEAAQGSVTEKRGAFDPTLVGGATVYGGKEPRNVVDTAVKTKTLFGPSFSVGWVRGVGDIPPYDLKDETGPSGEVYAKLDIPILEGLGWGEKRAALAAALAKQLGTEAKRDDIIRKVRFEAAKRYWKWVANAAILRVANDQLELARRRTAALERQVEMGNRPEMDLVDNERVLNERLAKAAGARTKLELAALDLSLFLRLPDGTPRVPTLDEVPEGWPAPDPIPEMPDLSDLGFRPDHRTLDAQVTAIDIEQRRARNRVLPDITVSGAAFEPLDADKERELMAGVAIDAPLAFRAGLGARRSADAARIATEAEQRALDDGIRAEINGAFVARRLAEEQAVAARIAAQRAQRVLELERRRFELGGSDLFQLLMRERSAASAREAEADAEFRLHVADAKLRAALAI